MIAGWTAEFVEDGYLFWSGQGDLTIGAKTYRGMGELVQLSPASEGVGIADDRLSVVLNVSDMETLVDQLVETPSKTQTFKFVASNYYGETSSEHASHYIIFRENDRAEAAKSERNLVLNDELKNENMANIYLSTFAIQFTNKTLNFQMFWTRDNLRPQPSGFDLTDQWEQHGTISFKIKRTTDDMYYNYSGVGSWQSDEIENVVMANSIDRDNPYRFPFSENKDASLFVDNSGIQSRRRQGYIYELEVTLDDGSGTSTVKKVVQQSLRDALLQDPGLQTIKINWIYSNDNGRTFSKSRLQFVGRLSAPSFDGRQYFFELEQYRGTGDNPIVWSDEFQKQLHPDDDGLEYMRVFGQPFQIKWPPPEAS